MQLHRLSNSISVIQGADKNLSKPDPACFLQVCQKLGVSSANTLMVGDSQGDILMAKNAGAAGVIGICWDNTQTNVLNDSDVIINTLEEIKIYG